MDGYSQTVVLLLCFVGCSAENNRVYNHRVYKLGETANLSCYGGNDTRHQINYWILHNNTMINATFKEITVSSDISELSIKRVGEDDYGEYLCMMTKADGQPVYSRTKLYFYQDLWEEYDKNVYVGLIAGGVVFILVSGACLVYNYSWSVRNNRKSNDKTSEHDEDENENVLGHKAMDDVYTNPTYEPEADSSTAVMEEKNRLSMSSVSQQSVVTENPMQAEGENRPSSGMSRQSVVTDTAMQAEGEKRHSSRLSQHSELGSDSDKILPADEDEDLHQSSRLSQRSGLGSDSDKILPADEEENLYF